MAMLHKKVDLAGHADDTDVKMSQVNLMMKLFFRETDGDRNESFGITGERWNLPFPCPNSPCFTILSLKDHGKFILLFHVVLLLYHLLDRISHHPEVSFVGNFNLGSLPHIFKAIVIQRMLGWGEPSVMKCRSYSAFQPKKQSKKGYKVWSQ